MISAKAVVDAGPKYLGTPYAELDCQAFVEKCLADAGLKINLSGSNAWFREVMKNGWVGTPKECKQKFGLIPPGAFLFIWANDGKEPEKYKPDGIGNASHIGIYTAMTGNQMVEACPTFQRMEDPANRKEFNEKVNFGNGAINSSKSRGGVCTSRFSGNEISGGWNRVGIWNRIDYGGDKMGYEARVTGGALNLRAEPYTSAPRLAQIPDGTVITVKAEISGWGQTEYNGKEGYVMTQYLMPVESGGDFVQVPRSELKAVYDWIGKLIGDG